MSILTKVKGSKNGNGSKEWTSEEVSVVFGLRMMGRTRKEISEVVGHSVASITYVCTRRFKSEDDLIAFTKLKTEKEYTDFATQYIKQRIEEQQSA